MKRRAISIQDAVLIADSFLHIQHTHSHTHADRKKIFITYRKLGSIIKPFYSVSASILLAQFLQILEWH